MTQDDTPDIEVSFADVAAESADDSLARETEATDALPEEAVTQAPDAESRNDSPPTQPTLSSMTGGGPVGDGDELAP